MCTEVPEALATGLRRSPWLTEKVIVLAVIAAAGAACVNTSRTRQGSDVAATSSSVKPLVAGEAQLASQASRDGSEIARELMRQAEARRAEKSFREAEILLSRAFKSDSSNVPVCLLLAKVQREMALELVEAGDLLAAARATDKAAMTVLIITGISVDPSTPSLDPKIVLDEEQANSQVSSTVRTAIDAACARNISEANNLATEAYRSWKEAATRLVVDRMGDWTTWIPVDVPIRFFVQEPALDISEFKNDRVKIVEGLIKLRPVFELGPWAGIETRMSANTCYSNLKQLVSPEEWNELLARAGFDPASRETLKRWSLE